MDSSAASADESVSVFSVLSSACETSGTSAASFLSEHAVSIAAVIASILSIITFFFILLPSADMLDISAFILEYGYFTTIRRKES